MLSSSRDEFREARLNLVNKLRAKGISDERVLNAIGRVPREEFAGTTFARRAYQDNALPIGEGQTISQPYTVAFMTEKLDVFEGAKVLEVGTGSGYQAAVLCELGARVFSIERIPQLIERSKIILKKLACSATVGYGDGTIGLAEFAPYDRIIVTAGSPGIPKSLKKQLKIGGKMVIPVGDPEMQTMYTVVRTSEEEFKEIPGMTFKFVPLIGKEGWRQR